MAFQPQSTEMQIFRAHVMGIDDLAALQHALPPIEEVIADIALLKTIVQLDGAFMDIEFAVPGQNGINIQLQDHSEPVRYNAFLRRLFSWSYLVKTDDVRAEIEGENILESVIFALKTLVKILEDESDDTLRLLGYMNEQPAEVAKQIRDVMLMNARHKLGTHLMQPDVNRPNEAAGYLHSFLNYHRGMYITFDSEERLDHWMRYPNIWVDCGEAFCLSGDFSEAKETLQLGLIGCEARPNQPGVDIYLLRCHIHLSLTLDRLHADPTAQKEHTDWAVRQLRRAPTRVISKEELEQYLQPLSEGRMHPVLESLGGKAWLKKLGARAAKGVLSRKEEEHSAKSCHRCGVRDVQKTLSRCARCQYCYYCSKDCQKADWKTHKEFCKNRREFLKALETQRKEDPAAAQRSADWDIWLDTPSSHRRDARISALGVHRDPSRGRTHVLMEGIKYTPEASNDPRFKFTIDVAGVFRIEDVLKTVELALDLSPGEGRVFVQSSIDDAESQVSGRLAEGDQAVPILVLSICSGARLQPSFSAYGGSPLTFRSMPYNPKWRRTINGTLGVEAGNMILKHQPDVQDAETVFEDVVE